MLDSPHTLVPMLFRGNTPITPIPTPQITSSRKPTQPTTLHSQRGRTGLERPDIEVEVDEGCPRLQVTTDSEACTAATHQHQPPPPATRLRPQQAAPLHGEGGQCRCRTSMQHHTTGCGPHPGPTPAAVRLAVPAPHVTPPRQQQQDGGREDVLSTSVFQPSCCRGCGGRVVGVQEQIQGIIIIAAARRTEAKACSGRGDAICVRGFSSVSHL
jgi:hypothetical protein